MLTRGRDRADAAGVFDILIVSPGKYISPATGFSILTTSRAPRDAGPSATWRMVLTGATGISALTRVTISSTV